MELLLVIITCFIVSVFAACAVYLAAEKAELKQLEKESKKNAKKAAEIIEKANETKANANSGNFATDFVFMANELHNLASKKK